MASWINDLPTGLDRLVILVRASEGNLLVLACAVSAGIHAALVRGHLAEGAGAALGFLGAAGVLGLLVVVLTRRPAPGATLAAAVFLAGLLASYALAVTSGLPLLHPEPEPVDGLALFTKAVEAAGLVAAIRLLTRGRTSPAYPAPRPKGTTT